MKNICLPLLLLLLSSTLTWGQATKISAISRQAPRMESHYTPASVEEEHIFLNMSFNSSTISNPDALMKLLLCADIKKVEVVYSDYPKGENFSSLIEGRLWALYKVLPPIFEEKGIEFELVRQTECQDEASARELFHGIVITGTPFDWKEYRKAEAEWLETAVLGEVEGDSVSYGAGVTDTTVSKIMNRNSEWKEMLIVADLTGSMTPYTADLLTWFQLQTMDNQVKNFVFFNDGDDLPDWKKKIGTTGGIYRTKANNLTSVLEVAKTTIENGTGGDEQENDLEAVLNGIKYCPECTDIVLIADNMAPVKDLALLRYVKKPIKIVLCGTSLGINPEYLTIARETGGSVHTIAKDISDLAKTHEGETISIEGMTYVLQEGAFVLAAEL